MEGVTSLTARRSIVWLRFFGISSFNTMIKSIFHSDSCFGIDLHHVFMFFRKKKKKVVTLADHVLSVL